MNSKKIMTIFALSIKKDWRHRGERLSLGKSAHTLCMKNETKNRRNNKYEKTFIYSTNYSTIKYYVNCSLWQ